MVPPTTCLSPHEDEVIVDICGRVLSAKKILVLLVSKVRKDNKNNFVSIIA